MKQAVVAWFVAGAFALGLVLSHPGKACAGDLAGSGDWQSLSGEGIQGTWTATLTQSGSEIRGTFAMTGSNLFRAGTVSGSIDGNRIVLGVIVDGVQQLTFSGGLRDGSISGEWSCSAIEDEGVWSGTMRDSASGS